MAESQERLAVPEDYDHNADHYPDAVTGLRRVIQEADLPDGPIEYLEVAWLANGSGTYRVRAPRAEETQGGYLPLPDHS